MRRYNRRVVGYSGTPLPKKLGIKAGHALLLVDAPAGFTETLGRLPGDVRLHSGLRGKGPYDVIVLFAGTRAAFAKRFARCRERLARSGGLWVGWPKKSSGVATDLTEAAVRGGGLSAGLVDNKICAIDETWSGLRFVYRLRDR